jgi:aerobic carbon-monoxide dehydrogenase medium subunit
VNSPPFAYARPSTLAEAAELLGEPGAWALAGGQSLIPLLARRAQRAALLVDLFGLGGFDEIRRDGQELRIGALARQRAVEMSPKVAEACPMLVEALGQVGHPATRNRGTIGGSLAHAEPAAELPTISAALGAHVTVRRVNGDTERLPVSELFTGPRRTSLGPGDLILELCIPTVRPSVGQAWMEFARRFADVPIVGVAATVRLGDDLRVAHAAAALAGVAPTPLNVSNELSVLMRGQPAETALLCRAAGQVAAKIAPPADLRGSAAVRRQLAITLLSRALVRARDRAIS